MVLIAENDPAPLTSSKAMEDPARQKITLKGYPVCQKVTPKGPDQPSICDELGVRICCFWEKF